MKLGEGEGGLSGSSLQSVATRAIGSRAFQRAREKAPLARGQQAVRCRTHSFLRDLGMGAWASETSPGCLVTGDTAAMPAE